MRITPYIFLLFGMGVLVWPGRIVAQKNPYGNIINPKAVNIPAPEYPRDAFNAGRGGQVIVPVWVDAKGKVSAENAFGPNAPCSNLKDPTVVSLRKAAIAAAKKAVFISGTIDGKPTSQLGLSIRYVFDPNDRHPSPGEAPAGGDTKLIDGNVLNDKALSLPKPRYPIIHDSMFGETSLTGDIIVAVLIAEDGHVAEASAFYGIPNFNEAVLASACRAKFSPTYVDGKPVKVSGLIRYSFGP